MSNDSRINAALFNFCSKLDDGSKGPVSSDPFQHRSPDDLKWLKEAIESVRAPDSLFRDRVNIIRASLGLGPLPCSFSSSNTVATLKGGSHKVTEEVGTSFCHGLPPSPSYEELMDALGYLLDEVEDINMGTECMLMQGPLVLLQMLQLSSMDAIEVVKGLKEDDIIKESFIEEKMLEEMIAHVPVVQEQKEVSDVVLSSSVSVEQRKGQLITINKNSINNKNNNSQMIPLLIVPTIEETLRKLPPMRKENDDAHKAVPSAYFVESIFSNVLIGNDTVRYHTAMILATMSQQYERVQKYMSLLNWADIVVPMLWREVLDILELTPLGNVPGVFVKKRDCGIYLQQSSTETQVLSKLISYLVNGKKVTAKTISALLHLCSCMSRQYEKGATEFLAHGGMQILQLILSAAAKPDGEVIARCVGNAGVVDTHPILNSKVLKRTFFFVEYLASLGVSSSSLVNSSCVLVGALAGEATAATMADGKETQNLSLLKVMSWDAAFCEEEKERLHEQVVATVVAMFEKSPKTVDQVIRETPGVTQELNQWKQMHDEKLRKGEILSCDARLKLLTLLKL